MALRPVGFIGLGIMGLPMALRLAQAGTPLFVWNRSAAAAERLAEAGATVARDPAEIFASAEIVILMLATEEAIDRVLGRGAPGFAALVRDRILVNMGTVSPEYSRALMEEVERHGGAYVEAPVSGSRVPAERGELLALVSGRSGALTAVGPALAPMCREMFDCGPVPGALVMKLSVNIFLVTMVTGLAEAFHFAGAHGIDPLLFRSVVDASPMASAVSRTKSEKLAAGDFEAQAAVSDVLKNAGLIADQARRSNVATPLVDVCRSLFAEAVALGEGALDMAAVVHAFAGRIAQAPPAATSLARAERSPIMFPPIVAADVAPRAVKSVYPEPFAMRMEGRTKRVLGDRFGLRNFGVNLTTLDPGAVSALQHRHSRQDELVYVLDGEVTLVRGGSTDLLTPGMCIGFPAGGDSHHLENRSTRAATYIEIGDRSEGDEAFYPADDLVALRGPAGWIFSRKDGAPYPPAR